MPTWNVFWRQLRQLPRAIWRLPTRQALQDIVVQNLQAQNQRQDTIVQNLQAQNQHLESEVAWLKARAEQQSMLVDHLKEMSESVHGALETWLPPESLPFTLHNSEVQWLSNAEARLGRAANDLSPDERTAAFYSYFSEMGGDTRGVLHRQYKAYLPLLEQVRESTASSHSSLWLDIGCGAGEFMAFLASHGWLAEGVDLSGKEVLRCQEQGLAVRQADALTYLQSLDRDGAAPRFVGISLLQVIEHVPPAQVMPLLQLCAKSLVPGGMLLVETVNLRHPLALNGFYTDPTHQTPLSDNYLAFTLQWLGLKQVGVLYTQPQPMALLAHAERTSHYVNYAVHGTAPPVLA